MSRQEQEKEKEANQDVVFVDMDQVVKIVQKSSLLGTQRMGLIAKITSLPYLNSETEQERQAAFIKKLEDAFEDLTSSLELEDPKNKQTLSGQADPSLEQRQEALLDCISGISGKLEELQSERDDLQDQKVSFGVRAVLEGLMDTTYNQLTSAEQNRIIHEVQRQQSSPNNNIALDDELGSVTN